MLEYSVAINRVLHEIVNDFVQDLRGDVVQSKAWVRSLCGHDQVMMDTTLRPREVDTERCIR